MTGYSSTPLAQKLGIRETDRIAFASAPDGFESALAPLPRAVKIKRSIRGPLDVIVAFSTRRAALERRLPVLIRAMEPHCGLWIAWPKQSSGVATDISGNLVRSIGLGAGLVDNKVCAIDQTWSGLRFVYRLDDR